MTTFLDDDRRITSRILVVEPDDDTRGLHGQLLQHSGCEIVEAFDGRDALVKALTYHPALVITELHLPFFDGHALCELLRRDSTTRSVPILVVTTERGRAQLERGRAAGADAFLVKPTTLDALFNQIRHSLASSCESQRAPVTASATTAAEPHQYAASTQPAPIGTSAESSHGHTSGSKPPHRPSDSAQPGLSVMRSPTPVSTKPHRWGQHSLPRTMGRVRVSDSRIVRSIRVSTPDA